MAEQPSYLGLINGIVFAEARTEQFLGAWAATTPEPELRTVLLAIVAREAEHAASFAKRVNELGFELQETSDPKFEERMAIATSDRTDLEKADLLGVLAADADLTAPDRFDDMFRDHTIDIRTGELLGRYIAEERDTARLLQQCVAQLRARACATERIVRA